jgi:hypothetical protein
VRYLSAPPFDFKGIEMSGGHGGFVLGQRPKRYKTLPQQERMREACEACDIRKGMKRVELVKAMKECLPEYYKKQREENVKLGKAD